MTTPQAHLSNPRQRHQRRHPVTPAQPHRSSQVTTPRLARSPNTMPTSPPSFCTKNCGTLVFGGGQCPECLNETRKQSDRQRPNGYRRGYTTEWAKFSRQFLAENPYCASPACRALPAWARTPATDVDHTDGHSRTCPHRYDTTHLQPLCHPCHSTKTATDDGSYGRTATTRCSEETHPTG